MNTEPKKFCFVLMPFSKDFDDVYNCGIKQSCSDAGAYCERVDEQIFYESILERIYNQISKADVVIADMTDKNPNVFYEVGYAHALGIPTILLTQRSDDIPFDLKHFPHIIYHNLTELKNQLFHKVKWIVENSGNKSVSSNIDIEIYYQNQILKTGDVECVVSKSNTNPMIKFTMQNCAYETYNVGDYRIGVITDENYTVARLMKSPISKTIMPDGRIIHMLNNINEILFPYSVVSFSVPLDRKVLEYQDDVFHLPKRYYESPQTVNLRLHTSKGIRDYPILIRYE